MTYHRKYVRRGIESLSNRERYVLEAICRDKTSRQIAAELHITSGTVDEHIDRVKTKLGVFASREQMRGAFFRSLLKEILT